MSPSRMGLTEENGTLAMVFSASLILALSVILILSVLVLASLRSRSWIVVRVRITRRVRSVLIVWAGRTSRTGSRRAGLAARATPPQPFEKGNTEHGCHGTHDEIHSVLLYVRTFCHSFPRYHIQVDFHLGRTAWPIGWPIRTIS